MIRALKFVGGEILSDTATDNSLRLTLRLGRTKKHRAVWAYAVESVLLRAEELKNSSDNAWTVDISQRYFLSPQGGVRYAWRLIFNGNVAAARDFLKMTLVDAGMRDAAIDGKVPYYGVKLIADPASGKTKGAYNRDSMGESVLAGMAR